MIAYTNYRFDARVRREAEALAGHGFQVLCLTPRNSSEDRKFNLNGVQVRELNVPKYRGKSMLSYTLSYLRFLIYSSIVSSRLVLKNKLDVVHVHNVPDFLIFAGVLPRLLGKGVILDIHDSVPETYESKFHGSSSLLFKLLCLEEKLSSVMAHRVICVNHPQKDVLVARGIPEKKIFVSMNVPDHGLFPVRCPNNEAPRGTFKVVYHGTMVRRLGVDLIIEAVARLVPHIPGIELNLWGTGDDIPEFQRRACELGISNIVQFKPEGVPLNELPRMLAGMDLGVVGNRKSIATELMLPVKLLEYVTLGIPAVAPRLKTIEHYFTDEMVCFYEPENVEALASSIEGLYRDSASRKAQADRAQRFLDDFGWEKQQDDLISLYSSLIER